MLFAIVGAVASLLGAIGAAHDGAQTSNAFLLAAVFWGALKGFGFGLFLGIIRNIKRKVNPPPLPTALRTAQKNPPPLGDGSGKF